MQKLNRKNLGRKESIVRSINPATLETLGEVEATAPDKVEGFVERAREGFPAWRDLGFEKRSEVIQKAQRFLLERSEEYARWITLEMGRSYVESLVLELEASVDLMGYYAKRARKFLGGRRLPVHNIFFKRRESTVHFQPLGVMGIISPWNWPLLIPLGFLVPALLAGNAVVFKHSELTPLFGVKIRELFLEAGVPEEIFQIVQGMGSVGAALVDSSVEKIFFTGSTAVGQKVMLRAARLLKPVVLEMGGSDPAIVCEDADLDITSSGIVWGGFNNCGQNCNGVERVYVHERVAEPFIDLVVEKAKQLRIGNGMNLEIDMGPVASQGQLLKMEAIVEMAVKMGAEVLTGGRRIENLDGYFFEPTLIRWDKSIPQPTDVEIFGPIITVTPVESDDEAVRLANRSSFGLASSVWTGDAEHGKRIARQLEAGTVMINDVVVSFGISEASWTGVKNSGMGWVHGEKGLDEMVNIQYINRDPQAHTQKFWWFPYTEEMVSAMKAGMNFLFGRSLRRRLSGLPRIVKNFTGYLLMNRRRGDKL